MVCCVAFDVLCVSFLWFCCWCVRLVFLLNWNLCSLALNLLVSYFFLVIMRLRFVQCFLFWILLCVVCLVMCVCVVLGFCLCWRACCVAWLFNVLLRLSCDCVVLCVLLLLYLILCRFVFLNVLLSVCFAICCVFYVVWFDMCVVWISMCLRLCLSCDYVLMCATMFWCACCISLDLNCV